MQVFDCRNFRELLDSYLSEELSVESNHSMLRHTEMCPECRIEMASRRQMRAVLKRACSRDRMSKEACDRVRGMLRAETSAAPLPGWKERLFGFFTVRQVLPVALAAAVVAASGLAIWMGGIRNPASKLEATLSMALIDQAVGDHENCGLKFLELSGPFEMPPSAVKYDPFYANLERIAAPGAAGLELRTSHLCGFEDRKFAHLVYTKNKRAISLLVTERDARALQTDRIPLDEILASGFQSHHRTGVTIGAYLTSRYVVLVVSDLNDEENRQMAERLAFPVTEHLRRSERLIARHGNF